MDKYSELLELKRRGELWQIKYIELEELNIYYSCQSDAMDKMISSYENLISAINDYKAILNSDIQVLKKVDQAMLEQNENAKNKVDKNIKVG